MLNFQGKAFNLKKPRLGIVTRKRKGILSRRNRVYVADYPGKACVFYAGVLSHAEVPEPRFLNTAPCIYELRPHDLSQLKEGDLVIMEPDGRVNVVWDAESPHNSIFATGRCNCSCVMCPQPPGADPDWLSEFNHRIIDFLDPSKTQSIGITGGEPTLLGKDLAALISTCKKRLPNTPVAVLTNGKRLRDLGFVKELAAVQHPGVTFCIPLYADNDTEHDRIVGVKGSFYETVQGLKNLALLRQKVEIRTVIHSLTYRRLLQFAEFVYRNFPFVVHTALMGMETVGIPLKILESLWIDPVDYASQLHSAAKYLRQRDMNVSVYNLQLCVIPRDLWSFSRKSISDWKNVFIDECGGCDYSEDCCGFFETSGKWHSKHIHSLKKADFGGPGVNSSDVAGLEKH